MHSMGVDPDSKQITLVILNENGEWMGSYMHKLKHDNNYRELTDELVKMIISPTMSGNTFCIPLPLQKACIEEGLFIQNPKTTLKIAYVIGYIMGVIKRNNVPVELVNNKTWKKVVIGNGNATKEQIMEYAKAKWGDKIKSQHMADAACIAEYATKGDK